MPAGAGGKSGPHAFQICPNSPNKNCVRFVWHVPTLAATRNYDGLNIGAYSDPRGCIRSDEVGESSERGGHGPAFHGEGWSACSTVGGARAVGHPTLRCVLGVGLWLVAVWLEGWCGRVRSPNWTHFPRCRVGHVPVFHGLERSTGGAGWGARPRSTCCCRCCCYSQLFAAIRRYLSLPVAICRFL